MTPAGEQRRKQLLVCLWPDTLLIDYQFTFSLSQEDDRYYTAINFVATPEEVGGLCCGYSDFDGLLLYFELKDYSDPFCIEWEHHSTLEWHGSFRINTPSDLLMVCDNLHLLLPTYYKLLLQSFL